MILIVTVMRVAAVPVMGMQAPLLPFGFAVFAAAYLGGFGPALAATAAASIAATVLFADFAYGPDAVAWIGHVLLFATLGGLVSLLMHRLQAAYQLQQRSLDETNDREEQLRTLTDAMPALIAYMDVEHRYRFNNKAYQDWFQLGRHALFGKHASEVLGEATYRAAEPHLKKALAGVPVDFDTNMSHRDGGTRHVSAHYIPDEGANGVVRGVFELVLDVSDRKRAEEALREADRRKDEFLAVLAHELRNPLAPISNVAHVLTDQKADIETLRLCGSLVQRQVATLKRLVDDLLDVARIRRGHIDLKREPTDLEKVIEHAIETQRPLLDASGQVVVVARSGTRVRVHGDGVRLEQVFVNLLANAAKFSKPRARIDLEIASAGDSITVHVRDQGAGIDPQLLPRIFDVFVQGNQSIDRPIGGLGIGLSLVKWIVDLHGGAVEARSEGLGKGSEFIVTLPALTELAPTASEPSAKEGATKRRRVLIVEDNQDAAESLRIFLQLAGHDVLSTNHAFAALEALNSFAPEWIFADIGLPGMDGNALAGMIRHHPNGKSARLLAVTGYGSSEDRELALRSGFDGHMTKPIDPNSLLALLRETSASDEIAVNA